MTQPSATAIPNSERSNQRYARLARTFDRRNVLVFNRVRAEGARRLQLKPGDHVLEAGSGTGANFANLVKAVGPEGKVTGAELSPDMAAVARERIAKEGWKNVEIRMGEAKKVELPTGLDGALFFMTHDIIRTPEAIDNVLSALKPGARVVSFGPKFAAKWNFLVRGYTIWKASSYHTTFEGFDKPWTPHLEERLVDFHVRPRMMGGAYMAWGRVPG
jgi:SAM-dependent methyltransferase